MTTSLGQFLRAMANEIRLFVRKPQCPFAKCDGARFDWTVFEQHVASHQPGDVLRVDRWADIRDPAGRWARMTSEEEA